MNLLLSVLPGIWDPCVPRAACAQLPSRAGVSADMSCPLVCGVGLQFGLRAGTAAGLCNVLVCNSLTYAGYSDTSGFGKTALLINMRANTADDCNERDLRHLISRNSKPNGETLQQ